MSRAITRVAGQRPGAHSVFALLLVAWLNLALTPCAMAFDATPDHNCPHCPPAAAVHDAHGDNDAGHGGHGMADQPMPCATAAADCLSPDESTLDARTGFVKLKDAPAEQPLAILPHQVVLPAAPARAPASRNCHYRNPGHPRPLNVLYCVYLK